MIGNVIQISIHAPCGGDRGESQMRAASRPFQSTPPYGGDLELIEIVPGYRISIHAPMRGRRSFSKAASSALVFQSTPPCGGDFRGSM